MSDTTQFDAESFMAETYEQPSETKFTPVPEGEYVCYIEDVAATSLGGSPALAVTLNIPDDNLKSSMNMDKITIRDNVFLDVENGRLVFGPNKNVRLGRIREAAGQNGTGPWNPNMLRGAGPIAIKVTHRFSKTGEGPYANVDRYAKA